MKLFNTLSRTIEEFKPINDKKVNLFVCGPTVYDFAHIGNAKTYTQFDFIVRYLRFRGYDVFYLQNITNIDDKIIKRAAERGISWDKLASEYEEKYYEDMKSLHNISVTKYARATDYIDQIVKQVKVLEVKEYAYKTSDGIYYDISKFKDYGKLSHRTQADRDAGVSRIDESLDKRNKNDFCLWKFSPSESSGQVNQPSWETELGRGRPGWHIEDTAITETFFGPQYDVHGGAMDLLFPHHEAEIAQIEAASGKSPLVRCWIHVAFLNMETAKMSKSKGNFITAREAVGKYGYCLLRYFFISAHYRTALEYSDEALIQAKGGLDRIDDFVKHIDKDYDDAINIEFVEKLRGNIVEKLDEDLNTPEALAAIFEFIREQNARGQAGKNVYKLFEELNAVFDFINLESPSVPEEIKVLLDKRESLRREKKFAEADAIRIQIEEKGIKVEDLVTVK